MAQIQQPIDTELDMRIKRYILEKQQAKKDFVIEALTYYIDLKEKELKENKQ